jgi:hypothetical protein
MTLRENKTSDVRRSIEKFARIMKKINHLFYAEAFAIKDYFFEYEQDVL